MRKLSFIFLLSFFSEFISAQTNLVPNPSFESYTTCPTAAGQLTNCVSWFLPSTGTSDYFNSCATTTDYAVNVPVTFVGNANANSGNAMAGVLFFDNVYSSFIYREYLAAKLTGALINNQKYYVNYSIRLADSARYGTDKISVFFIKTV